MLQWLEICTEAPRKNWFRIDNTDGDFSVIIVNDCSSEKLDVLIELGKKKPWLIQLILKITRTQDVIKLKIKYISKNSIDYLILADGDGEDNPEDIDKLLKQLLKTKIICSKV